MVCFINNKTPQYLDSLSEEERHKLIEGAVKEKVAYVKKYQQMKQKIRQRRIEIMEERRKKIAKQAENKEKRKEQLDIRLEDYNGLWRTADEMKTNLDILPLSKQKDALVTQIKYRKFVLGIKPTEKTLLQLQSGKEKFTTEQLQENLETVLHGVTQSAHVLNTKHVNIKCKEEREEELSAIIDKKKEQQKRKQQNEHLGFKMVGKRILHKWVDDGKEKWYTGKVIQAIGDIQDEECRFEIKDNDGDE